MIIGGLQKFSLLDYPGHLAAIIFTQGCNFRCHFCYNPMLVRPPDELEYASASINQKNGAEAKDHRLTSGDLFVFLESRVGKLDGVVITGGEPTIHPDLPDFIRKIRALGLKVKLDTNGTNPEMLEKLINENLVDYLAMDIKAAPEHYDEAAGVRVDLEKIRKSVKMIIESHLPHEFRTTLVPGLIEQKDLRAMGELIRGASRWYLQRFKSDIDLVDQAFKGAAGFAEKELLAMTEAARKYVPNCELR